jgi:hypothetical protein
MIHTTYKKHDPPQEITVGIGDITDPDPIVLKLEIYTGVDDEIHVKLSDPPDNKTFQSS